MLSIFHGCSHGGGSSRIMIDKSTYPFAITSCHVSYVSQASPMKGKAMKAMKAAMKGKAGRSSSLGCTLG